MTSDKLTIKRLAILGVGLIGGSLARVLRREGVCNNIVGFGRNEDNLKKAIDLGVIDEYALQASEAVKDADMVVLATPLSTTDALLMDIKGSIKADATITDVGSVKGSVVNSAQKILSPEQYLCFVPGHPIAGTEKSGVEASISELFEDHLVILTPTPELEEKHLRLVTQMWEIARAKVVSMAIDHHDQILAVTSHLPHMLAYALVDCLAGMQSRDEIFQYAAGGFADFSRIASSSPRMWTDICFANRKNLVDTLDKFDKHILDIKEAITAGDNDLLLEIFSRAKTARDEFTQKLRVKSEK